MFCYPLLFNFGFLRECKGLGDVSVVWTRPVCLGYSFPCLGLVSGDFYVFRRLQYFTDVFFFMVVMKISVKKKRCDFRFLRFTCQKKKQLVTLRYERKMELQWGWCLLKFQLAATATQMSTWPADLLTLQH